MSLAANLLDLVAAIRAKFNLHTARLDLLEAASGGVGTATLYVGNAPVYYAALSYADQGAFSPSSDEPYPMTLTVTGTDYDPAEPVAIIYYPAPIEPETLTLTAPATALADTDIRARLRLFRGGVWVWSGAYVEWAAPAPATLTGAFDLPPGEWATGDLLCLAFEVRNPDATGTIMVEGATATLSFTATVAPPDVWSFARLTSAVETTLTTYSAASELTFDAAPNTTYRVELHGAYQTAATTTGLAVALDVPAGASVIGASLLPSSNTALQNTIQRADGVAVSPSTAVPAANADLPLWGQYTVTTGATAGPVTVMLRSEVATSAARLMPGLTMGWRAIP